MPGRPGRVRRIVRRARCGRRVATIRHRDLGPIDHVVAACTPVIVAFPQRTRPIARAVVNRHRLGIDAIRRSRVRIRRLVEMHLLVERHVVRLILDVRPRVHDPHAARIGAISLRQLVLRRVEILHRHAPLPQRVLATRAAARLAGRLDRRQQQRDQNADDRNHDQQFDECKCRRTTDRLIAFSRGAFWQ